MSWAPAVISSLTKVGEKKGNKVGAKRVLNDAFHETLTEIDPGAYTFKYTIDDGPGPISSSVVSKYTGAVKLTESENGTIVEWSSTFESADSNKVADFCNPIYSSLLAALNTTLS